MIREFLKKRDRKDVKLIQGFIPKDVAIEAIKIKDEMGWTWDEILTAFCKDFIKEFKGDSK